MGQKIQVFTARFGPTIMLVLAIVSPVGAFSWQISSQLSKLSERVSNLGDKVDDLGHRVEKIETQNTEITVSIARLDERLSVAEVRIK